MTSFIIGMFNDRSPAPSWSQDSSCPFCKIVNGNSPAYKVYENDKVIAFLDIMPLRPGHILVVPKTHVSRLSELPSEFAGAVGMAVSKIAQALTEALGNTGLNVVCNQEYAQAVPHVHYHIIPAPTLGSSLGVGSTNEVNSRKTPLTVREMHRKEFESREELDDDEANTLVEKIRTRL